MVDWKPKGHFVMAMSVFLNPVKVRDLRDHDVKCCEQWSSMHHSRKMFGAVVMTGALIFIPKTREN